MNRQPIPPTPAHPTHLTAGSATAELFGTIGKARVSSCLLAAIGSITSRIAFVPPPPVLVPIRR